MVCKIRVVVTVEPVTVAPGISLVIKALVAPDWLRCTTITDGLETLLTCPLDDTTLGCNVLMAEAVITEEPVLRPCWTPGLNEAVLTVTTR